MGGVASMLDTEVFALLKMQQEYLDRKAASNVTNLAAELARAKQQLGELRSQLATKESEKHAAVQAATAEIAKEIKSLQGRIKVPPAPRTMPLPAL